MTKHADPKPPYCSSCWGFNSDWHFIDFEAAYDGPVIPGSPANVPVDDLIICQNCLAEAFALIDTDGLHLEIDAQRKEIDHLNEVIASKDRAIREFHMTTTELVKNPVQKVQGRLAYRGIPDDAKAVLDERRAESRRKAEERNKEKVS